MHESLVERHRRRHGGDLLARRGDDAQRVVVLPDEDGVASGDLELAVAAVVRHRVADLDRSQHAAGRPQLDRGEVFHALAERPRAQLRPGDRCVLSGQLQEEIQQDASRGCGDSRRRPAQGRASTARPTSGSAPRSAGSVGNRGGTGDRSGPRPASVGHGW